MAKKKAKAKKRDRYADFAAEWDRRRKAPDRGGGEWLVDKPELPVDPLPFLQTLRRLGYVTQDDRFIELHSDLMQSDLIDPATEKWSFFSTKLTRLLPELIEEAIAADTTERQAIAEAVAVFELYPDAQNFDAAWTYRRSSEGVFRVSCDGVEIGSISKRDSHTHGFAFWHWGIDALPRRRRRIAMGVGRA